jgi:hypothetical protein
VKPRHSGLPCAVVYGLLRALPGEPSSIATVARKELALHELGASVGRQDHTTSPSVSATLVRRSHHVHRIPPHVRDDRDPPLASGETGRAGSADLLDALSEMFFRAGLDRANQVEMSWKLSLA